MNYTALLYKKRVIGYSHSYGSLEHSCLVTECREPTKSAKKPKTTCWRTACVPQAQVQPFQQELEHFPSSAPHTGCSYHTSLAAKYKLQRDAKLQRDIWHPRLSLATGSVLASVSPLVNPSSWAAAIMTLVNCRTWVYLLSFGTDLCAQLFCSGRLQQLKQESQGDTISHQNKQLSWFSWVKEKNEYY